MSVNAQVVYLDDENVHTQFVLGEMAALGYDTLLVRDVKTADAALRQHKPTLLIAHLNLLKNDVVQFVQEFKKYNPHTASIFILQPNVTVTEKVYKAGADIVISLPLEPQAVGKSAVRLIDPLGPGKFRIYERFDLKLDVSWCPTQSQSLKKSTTLNVSGGGFFVLETQLLPKRKEIIDFVLDFKRPGVKRLSGKGIVRWLRTSGASKELPGFGVELLLSSKEFQENIKLING